MIHQLLEVISTSKTLLWFTLNIIAPIDRQVMRLSKGRFSITGSNTVLLVTRGAKTGMARYSSLPGMQHNNDIIILASKGGGPKHPAWFHNLSANPDVKIIHKGEQLSYLARTADAKERVILWQWDGFEAYQHRAAPRILPIVILSPDTNPI